MSENGLKMIILNFTFWEESLVANARKTGSSISGAQNDLCFRFFPQHQLTLAKLAFETQGVNTD